MQVKYELFPKNYSLFNYRGKRGVKSIKGL